MRLFLHHVPPCCMQIVLHLIEAKPEWRAGPANKLLASMLVPSMSGYVWDELCRSRKTGPMRGLYVLIEMLDSQGKKHLLSGQPPSLQLITLASINPEGVAVLMGKPIKKLMIAIMAVLGDEQTSLHCKENAAWILRRVTEGDAAKPLFAGSRDHLMIISKMLSGEYRGCEAPTVETIGSPNDEQASPTRAISAEKSQVAVASVSKTHDSTASAADNEEIASPIAAKSSHLQELSFTGMANTGVAFASDVERCAIEGNCCLALAQSALKDELLERLGSTKGILNGLIHVLSNGTEWAAGNAARALANIAYRPENLGSFVTLIDESMRENLVSGLSQLAKDKMRLSCKRFSALCIANLAANEVLLMKFLTLKGLKEDLLLMQKINDPAVATEASRAVLILNQARFGTISWRQPKRI